jgi:hypothetical protein
LVEKDLSPKDAQKKIRENYDYSTSLGRFYRAWVRAKINIGKSKSENIAEIARDIRRDLDDLSLSVRDSDQYIVEAMLLDHRQTSIAYYDLELQFIGAGISPNIYREKILTRMAFDRDQIGEEKMLQKEVDSMRSHGLSEEAIRNKILESRVLARKMWRETFPANDIRTQEEVDIEVYNLLADEVIEKVLAE